MNMWGIHNNEINDQLVEGGFVSVGWELGDLTRIGNNRERMKAALRENLPDAKEGAIPIWSGILLRFAFEMNIGDLVISPNKSDGTLNFGEIIGNYEFHPEVRRHRHRRPVQWIRTDVPRGLFPKTALYEIGSALTLFRVKRHTSIFMKFLESNSEEDFLEWLANDDLETLTVETPSEDIEIVVEEEADALPTAERIRENTNDFIIRTLLEELEHEEFEHFTADLLRAMGYQARVTSYSSDGGVDILAHRDPLGLEPPLIKVQCKHTTASKGRPEVQGLLGALAPKDEHGLFVTLGVYSRDAAALERERQNIRLLGGKEITELTLQYYDQLPIRWRDKLPLRKVYVVDQEI
ncbi:restriction endonuclease [Kocuria sp. cx-455]|uniref:restriction endonuclease n=1 Tax=Kocuria sp. cx-455 TaxID=2771377 RepID=UPI001689ECE0|nr:restriction endonuclease [Kocuria sp. cx-455]MBD2765911.1 restriction endonuclease [Kocuria sp. cx-455]